jgi:hypothetical protein
MNRRGEDIFDFGQKFVYWTIAVIVLTLIAIAFKWYLFSSQAYSTTRASELKAEAIALRFGNIPECFANEDLSSGKVFSNTIVLSNFTKPLLDKCYSTNDETRAKTFHFRLKLEKEGTEIISDNYGYKDDFTLYHEVFVINGLNIKNDMLVIYVQEGLKP